MKLFKSEEHTEVASTLNNMALIESGLGHFQKALEMNEKIYGRNVANPFA